MKPRPFYVLQALGRYTRLWYDVIHTTSLRKAEKEVRELNERSSVEHRLVKRTEEVIKLK